jgi:hypothetical protein
MDVQIIDLDTHLEYLRETGGIVTHIAVIDVKESLRRQTALAGWTEPSKTPTDTAPREWIRGNRLPDGQTTIAVTDDLPVLLNFVNQRAIIPGAWVYIQKSRVRFPEHTYLNMDIPGGAAVRTGKLDDSNWYVAAQAADLALAGEAIEHAAADPDRTIAALGKKNAALAQSQRK